MYDWDDITALVNCHGVDVAQKLVFDPFIIDTIISLEEIFNKDRGEKLAKFTYSDAFEQEVRFKLVKPIESDVLKCSDYDMTDEGITSGLLIGGFNMMNNPLASEINPRTLLGISVGENILRNPQIIINETILQNIAKRLSELYTVMGDEENSQLYDNLAKGRITKPKIYNPEQQIAIHEKSKHSESFKESLNENLDDVIATLLLHKPFIIPAFLRSNTGNEFLTRSQVSQLEIRRPVVFQRRVFCDDFPLSKYFTGELNPKTMEYTIGEMRSEYVEGITIDFKQQMNSYNPVQLVRNLAMGELLLFIEANRRGVIPDFVEHYRALERISKKLGLKEREQAYRFAHAEVEHFNAMIQRKRRDSFE